jgi:hypothetical protein
MRTFAVAVAATLFAATAGSAAAQAQTRHGRGGRPVVVVRGYYGPYYAPFYGWSPYAFGFAPYYGFGYGYGYGYGYSYGPYGPYAPYRYDDTASARVQVTPKQTEVYVDGYLAGVADDFDGTFQRLHIRPGGHQITLYLDGHRSVTERLYFSPGKTQKIKMAMVPLAPGEAPQPRPVAPARTSPAARDNSSQRPTS